MSPPRRLSPGRRASAQRTLPAGVVLLSFSPPPCGAKHSGLRGSNMPDAIDARLASLALEGFAVGEFTPLRTEYQGVAAERIASTTVTAEAATAA